MINSKEFSSETNCEQYPHALKSKSIEVTSMADNCQLLLKTKDEDMFNHSTTYGQICNQNQLSRLTNNSNSSPTNSRTKRSGLSSLVTLKTKHKQQLKQLMEYKHIHHHHVSLEHQHHQLPFHPRENSQHGQQRRRRRGHAQSTQGWLLFSTLFFGAFFMEHSVPVAKADQNIDAIAVNDGGSYGNVSTRTQMTEPSMPTTTLEPNLANHTSTWLFPNLAFNMSAPPSNDWLMNGTSRFSRRKTKSKFNGDDSIFLRFAKRFTDDNNLVSGIIQECYQKPTFACFQKNVYVYLNEVLDAQDVNVTQRLKFYRNENLYSEQAEMKSEFGVKEEGEKVEDEEPQKTTQASAAKDPMSEEYENEIHREGRSYEAPVPETPIEEVTNALYGKSVKFAMTHNIELQLPEMMFDGATFRISPRSIEGNGVIAKLELIPKQHNEARLAGFFIKKKLQKLMKSKILLSFLALVLIIKIIKVKIFWLLPLIIGVGAAKKLLLKFLLFLFPALSHLFKLCSYYQQTYHTTTKYHHHHHHIDHHHTVIPPWQGGPEPHHVPEIIYSKPPKGHISTYLHGAPIHETYGPPPSSHGHGHSHPHEHFEGGWENSGPGLGSEYISDVNRVAHIDDGANFFKPHSSEDANELHAWGLGTTPFTAQKTRTQTPIPPHHKQFSTPPLQKPNQTPQNYQKPQATSQTFNPFKAPGDKQSFFNNKYRNNVVSQSAPSPVYSPVRPSSIKPQIQEALTTAAQIAAQYDPTKNQIINGGDQFHLTPEQTAQLKEALRIQAEQRLVQQQQQILEKQPFVQDGQPLLPLNYDPFYSPILLKVDKIIEQLGIKDDPCRERVICSMYKDPERYSPHSNFVSAELSRDTSELQPITSTNPAVIRFFRFIQAARDGQDNKNCLELYPKCNINTE
ncbi:DUF1676 domain-containing protein Osi17 isoform X1 [Haematobia irritans]|uniref:DUF1676 domain-containing protein Osi17 isoform X1 n=1 Tax=Haematobia irritans TaxID=7368 RepID=UPI003F4FD781